MIKKERLFNEIKKSFIEAKILSKDDYDETVVSYIKSIIMDFISKSHAKSYQVGFISGLRGIEGKKSLKEWLKVVPSSEHVGVKAAYKNFVRG